MILAKIRIKIGRFLMKIARKILYRGQNKYCWICGAAAGLGPFWAGAITCWDCYERWHYFHKPKENMVVDPWGLGRIKKCKNKKINKKTKK